jgi:DNA topoisomerase VI subunit A
MFLARITNELKIPVLGLVDSDPYGLKILSVYMSGSKNMSYDSASLTTPDIMWLGLRPSDYGKYNLPEQCLLDMTENDIKTGHELMKEDFIMKNPKWMKELEIMVRMGRIVIVELNKVPKSLPSILHLVGQNKEEGRNSGLVVVWFPVPHRRVLAAKVA